MRLQDHNVAKNQNFLTVQVVGTYSNHSD